MHLIGNYNLSISVLETTLRLPPSMISSNTLHPIVQPSIGDLLTLILFKRNSFTGVALQVTNNLPTSMGTEVAAPFLFLLHYILPQLLKYLLLLFWDNQFENACNRDT